MAVEPLHSEALLSQLHAKLSFREFLEELLAFIPGFGIAIDAHFADKRYGAIIQDIAQQLAQRKNANVLEYWRGDDQEIVKGVTRIIHEEIGWEYPYFIPEDPLYIIGFQPYPGSDWILTMARIEERYAIEFSEQEFNELLKKGTMQDLIELIQQKSEQYG